LAMPLFFGPLLGRVVLLNYINDIAISSSELLNHTFVKRINDLQCS
jgi:hypothetical protein